VVPPRLARRCCLPCAPSQLNNIVVRLTSGGIIVPPATSDPRGT
jgi:hypothetical protein